MNGHTNTPRIMGQGQPWTPCRRHLFDLYAAITPGRRHLGSWRIPAPLWDAIKHDPNLNADWTEGSYRNTTFRTLLGSPVDLVARGLDHIQFVVTLDCRPPRRPVPVKTVDDRS